MLLALREHATVTTAAASLGLTQSALSHRMREAGRRLGVPLFNRDRNGMRLTAAGERILESARTILTELERTERAARLLGGNIDHIVRIASRANACNHWLAAFLRAYQPGLQRTGFEIDAEAGAAPLEALRSGAIDLALLSGPQARGDFRVLSLFRDELVAMLPASHRHAHRPYLVPADFADETYVTYSTERLRGHEYDLFFHKYGVEPARYLKVGLVEAVVAFVRAGFGVSILGRSALVPYARVPDVVTIPVTAGGIHINWFAVLRKGRQSGTAVLRLATALAAWCRSQPAVLAAGAPGRRARRS